MQVRTVTLAIVAVSVWLIPSESPAQGNSGKKRLTICHISPGNPDARRTMKLPESAWPAHEYHGDSMGPCGGNWVDDRRAKRDRKAKGGKRNRSETGGGAGDVDGDEVEIHEAEGGSDGDELDDRGPRTDREQRRAERRTREDREDADRGSREDEEVEDDDGDAGRDGEEVEDRTRRGERRAERERRTRDSTRTEDDASDASDDSDAEQKGFTRRWFGFGGDDDE